MYKAINLMVDDSNNVFNLFILSEQSAFDGRLRYDKKRHIAHWRSLKVQVQLQPCGWPCSVDCEHINRTLQFSAYKIFIILSSELSVLPLSPFDIRRVDKQYCSRHNMSRRIPNPAADRAAQNQQTIKTLLKLEGNKSCADCKRNKRMLTATHRSFPR